MFSFKRKLIFSESLQRSRFPNPPNDGKAGKPVVVVDAAVPVFDDDVADPVGFVVADAEVLVVPVGIKLIYSKTCLGALFRPVQVLNQLRNRWANGN